MKTPFLSLALLFLIAGTVNCTSGLTCGMNQNECRIEMYDSGRIYNIIDLRLYRTVSIKDSGAEDGYGYWFAPCATTVTHCGNNVKACQFVPNIGHNPIGDPHDSECTLNGNSSLTIVFGGILDPYFPLHKRGLNATYSCSKDSTDELTFEVKDSNTIGTVSYYSFEITGSIPCAVFAPRPIPPTTTTTPTTPVSPTTEEYPTDAPEPVTNSTLLIDLI